MKTKIKVPVYWYNETKLELMQRIVNCRVMPIRLKKRIDAVIQSGLDYELLKLPNSEHKLPLDTLKKWLVNAEMERERLHQYEKDLIDFKEKYEPCRLEKGNLKAAKLDVRLKKQKESDFYDFKYVYLADMVEKYKLSNRQTDSLMNLMSKLNII